MSQVEHNVIDICVLEDHWASPLTTQSSGSIAAEPQATIEYSFKPMFGKILPHLETRSKPHNILQLSLFFPISICPILTSSKQPYDEEDIINES
jgi:hypothetical protein